MNKSVNKYLIYILLVLVVLGGAAVFTYLTFTGRIDNNPLSTALVTAARPYPKLTGPRDVTLNCNFHGKNITVSETLYDSLDSYYKTDPQKKYEYLHDDNKDMVFSYSQDNTVKDLAAKIESAGTANGLGRDETLDLGACLMQSIPYDTAKANKILSPDFTKFPIDEVIPRYPYETLYDFAGICTDKSFLGAAVFREMGYETSLLTFDAQKHMSIGVGVPAGYGNFGMGYGIMELTGENFRVGDIPEVSSDAGLAINNFQTIPQNSGTTQTNNLQLSNPSAVIAISTGSVYERIVQKAAVRQKLEAMKPQLDQAKANISATQATLSASESAVKSAEAAYKANPNQATYSTYSSIYAQYQRDYNAAQAAVNYYNSLVKQYNSLVEQYQQF